MIGFGALAGLYFAVNPYIRRAALRRLGSAVVLGDDGVYVTKFQRTISRHPVVQLFVEHESDGQRVESLAHLGPSNNDDAFREFAEQELDVPFTSHTEQEFVELPVGSVTSIRGM